MNFGGLLRESGKIYSENALDFLEENKKEV
jgi:hypothetical protein